MVVSLHPHAEGARFNPWLHLKVDFKTVTEFLEEWNPVKRCAQKNYDFLRKGKSCCGLAVGRVPQVLGFRSQEAGP